MTPGGEMCPEYPAQSPILAVILMDCKEEGNCPAYTNIGRKAVGLKSSISLCILN